MSAADANVVKGYQAIVIDSIHLVHRVDGKNKTFYDLFLAVFEMTMHQGKARATLGCECRMESRLHPKFSSNFGCGFREKICNTYPLLT